MESSYQNTQGLETNHFGEAEIVPRCIYIIIRRLCTLRIIPHGLIFVQTTELTRLQVGGGLGPVNIIVSTLIEAENIVPLLLEYEAAGRVVNVGSGSFAHY
jgi:hypothetical protein